MTQINSHPAKQTPNSIEIDGVGKQYRLGMVGTGTLAHDLNRWWAITRGKPDPYLKVGQVNQRDAAAGGDQYVWALRDVSFSVKSGEAVGIIGANGAGKSTLLKLLSRVTAPSAGVIRMRGRIASLLEVGTGFHRELSGSENVYLNGAIMGLTRAEVTERIGEIFEFAGVARYADTPIKRYSTGMKVRLAFAVAAHLEPDILIVDEVLAVGDAEFQRKAIGKMREVAAGVGRTVLFVSHDMEAIARLCNRGIVLDRGGVAFDGPAPEAIQRYAALNFGKPKNTTLAERTDRKGLGSARYTSIGLFDGSDNPVAHAEPGRPLTIRCAISADGPRDVYASVAFRDSNGAPFMLMSGWARHTPLRIDDGSVVEFKLDALGLAEGKYLIDLQMNDTGGGNVIQDQIDAAATVAVQGKDYFRTGQVSTMFRERYHQDFELAVVQPKS